MWEHKNKSDSWKRLKSVYAVRKLKKVKTSQECKDKEKNCFVTEFVSWDHSSYREGYTTFCSNERKDWKIQDWTSMWTMYVNRTLIWTKGSLRNDDDDGYGYDNATKQ